MNLYVHKVKEHKGKAGETLIKNALKDYSKGEYSEWEIKRGEKGKPFFDGLPIHFSVSHSGDIWACLMADFQVGIDIQIEKKMNHRGIAKRFFSKGEADYVEQNGESAFFKLWTMKEAYVKYTGRGFSEEGFAEPVLIEDGVLAEYIVSENKKIYFKDISAYLKSQQTELETELYGVVCSEHMVDFMIDYKKTTVSNECMVATAGDSYVY